MWRDSDLLSTNSNKIFYLFEIIFALADFTALLCPVEQQLLLAQSQG